MLTVTPESYHTNPAHRRFADEVFARLGIDIPSAHVTRLEVSEAEVVVWQIVQPLVPLRWCSHHCHGSTSRGVPILCQTGMDGLCKRTRYDLTSAPPSGISAIVPLNRQAG